VAACFFIGLTLRLQIELQLRPSKVGRPKGSRDKRPRASKTGMATSSSQEFFQILDSAINSHQIDSSRRAQSSVDQAHPTSINPSSHLWIAEISSRVGVTCCDKRHHGFTQFTSHTTTPEKAFNPAITLELRDVHRPSTPIAFHSPSFEPLDIRRPTAPVLTSDGGRPFEPADAYNGCPTDAAAPAHGAPGFADPFHFDWPHW
jgi:hypothetical protein